MTDRHYQQAATAAVAAHWKRGTKRVVLVSPTGSGKTVMGTTAVSDGPCVLWLSHRADLVEQTAERLIATFGRRAVGVILAGQQADPRARYQVGTVQSYLSRTARSGFPWAPTHVVLDEAHHYVADEWIAVHRMHPDVYLLGLTATPEREDGKALGDIFQEMVVAADYPELVRDGYLVPAKVWRPERALGADIAQDPLEAWKRHARGTRTFVFCSRVAIAETLVRRFVRDGVSAAVIHAGTPAAKRRRTLGDFRARKIMVICNVHTMTEGIDVPEATTAVLARRFSYPGAMLQATGRVLRPALGKSHAIVIDLTGCTIRHGLPTEAREYSLHGRPISGTRDVEPPERGEFSQETLGVDLHLVSDGAELEEPSLPPPPHPPKHKQKSVNEMLGHVIA